jgi:AraC family transcriptional regulator
MDTLHGLRIGNYAPRGAMAAHAHPEPGISIVLRGGFAEHIGRRVHTYSRGEISYLPAGMVHAQSFGPAGARQIIFRPQTIWIEYLADCRTPTRESLHANGPAFGHLGDRLQDELVRDDDVSLLACEGLMLESVAAFARQHANNRVPRAIPPWLWRAREYVHEHSSGAFTLRDIARAAGRHEVHLAREFRRYFHESVGSCVRRLRVEKAAQLLAANAAASITEIALVCGLSSHSHLCREFRRHFGVSPSQYRTGTR